MKKEAVTLITLNRCMGWPKVEDRGVRIISGVEVKGLNTEMVLQA